MNRLDPDKAPKLIRELFSNSAIDPSIKTNIDDDDCAVFKIGKLYYGITTDFLNSKTIAEELDIGSFREFGRLVAAANLSDLIGSGFKPYAFLLSVMLKKGSSDSDFKELMKGVKEVLDTFEISLIGGDTKLGKEFSVAGFGIGISEYKPFLKKNAKEGDLIFTTGELGSTCAVAIGYNAIFDKNWRRWATQVVVDPSLPFKKTSHLAKKNICNCGTDISDGLGRDLNDLCRSSNVGAIVDVDKIPINSQVHLVSRKLDIEPWSFAFGIGGDFESIVCVSPKHKDTLVSLGFTLIGEITKEKDMLINNYGKISAMPIKGHNDLFKKSFSGEASHLLKEIKNND